MRTSMKKCLRNLLCITCISVGILPSPANAAPVTFYFQGSIASVDPGLTTNIDTTKTLRGSYTFESTTPDLLPSNSTFGRYAITSLSYSLGGLTFSATSAPGSSNVITISNQIDPNFDRYDVAIGATLSGPNVNGHTNDQFYFQFEKVGLFSADTLPSAPPSISSTSQNMWYARFTPGGQLVRGQITSLTLTPVPLPGAGMLFATGLTLAIYIIRRKKSAQQENVICIYGVRHEH